MAGDLKLEFAPLSVPPKGVLVLFCEEGLKFSAAARRLVAPTGDLVARAAAADRFKGKNGATLDIVAPPGLGVSRLIVVGVGKARELESNDFVKLGGVLMGKLPRSTSEATIVADLPDGSVKPDRAIDLALGIKLRRYSFDRYKSKRKEDEEKPAQLKVIMAVAQSRGCSGHSPRAMLWRTACCSRATSSTSPPMCCSRQNSRVEPASCGSSGSMSKVLDVKAMKKLGMNALLGVGQGSQHESRAVIMRWNGGKRATAPIAFIGKGVCFDTGGISIKPAASMEDMKGDMAGAACVVGLMHALAARKAKVNAVGAIGLVENMPDGRAQRPGDIVTAMSGQTIEIINTDAEGRLVLCDLLHYVNKRFKPKFMIDLATLTGAIIVALGQEHAGLFANDDKLAERLIEAGKETGERVWRMPLAPEYDKMIDSKFADMKNSGGRHGGAITAAQLLQRFVDETPWAHLDIAGTGMGSPQTDINRSWGSGFGVRLLNRLVAEHYEK